MQTVFIARLQRALDDPKNSNYWGLGTRIELGHPTGITVIPGAPAPVVATGVRIVLRHNPGSDTGYFIYTAYPD